MPGAGEIVDPAKQRSHTIQGTVSSVASDLQTWLQAQAIGTTYTLQTVRANNSQGLIVLIAYEIP